MSHTVAVKTFADIRTMGIRVVEERHEPIVPNVPAIVEPAKPATKTNTGVATPVVKSIVERLVRPTLVERSESPEVSIGKVAAIAEALYEARGYANAFPLAEHIVSSFAAAAVRAEPDLALEKRAMRALERITRECGVGSNRAFWATRTRSVLKMLEETPAVDSDGNFIFIDRTAPDTPVVTVVNDIKAASNAREYFELYQPIDDRAYSRLETACTTKPQALRMPPMHELRNTVPDFGLALVLAALMSSGFNRNHVPNANLIRTNFLVLSYVENLILSLQMMVSTSDEYRRGEILCGFIEGEHAVTLDEFIQLHNDLKPIRVSDTATTEERALARATYNANRALFDARQAEWGAIQNELNTIQQEAAEAVDAVLAFVRYKRDEKEYARKLSDKRLKKPTNEPVGEAEVGRTVSAIRPTPKAVTSVYTPDEAVAAAAATSAGIEADITIPTFNLSSLELTEASRKRMFKAAGIDGGRELSSVYPGVVWEAVIGPIDHVMDFERTESDTRMVVIAPRRVGNLGLDMAEARTLLVSEYEEYFTPVE